MPHETFVPTLALIGLVILVASLLSGAVERSGLPQVAIFLLFGALLGPAGLALIDLPLESDTLQVMATLALVLVLFIDAIAVDAGEVRTHRRLTALILGPGTILPAALIALAAWALLDLPPAAAAILGAALASTDPVLLRTLIRNATLPPRARLALRLESGMNDVILLPIVVLAMVVLRTAGEPSATEVARHAVGLFLLGPLLGAAVGYVAITLLERVRSQVGVRRDYESIYALGVAFTAFAAAEAAGGSGFLAAFAAGLVIAALDVELCDCFMDYGEASAEMFLLLTFVTFGASIIWTGFEVADVSTLIFALIALAVRTVVLLPVLSLAGVEPRSRKIIAWLGPRGLSALLLALLPVFAGVEGSVRLFQITCLVVLLSVLLHGGGITVFLRLAARGAGRCARRDRGARRQARAAGGAVIRQCRSHGRGGGGTRADHDPRAPPAVGAGRAGRIAGRADRAELPRRSPDRRGRDQDAARRRGAIGPGARPRPARHGGALLYLKGRSHKRPCGARASSSGMEEGEGAGRRMGGVEWCGPAGKGEVSGVRRVADEGVGGTSVAGRRSAGP